MNLNMKNGSLQMNPFKFGWLVAIGFSLFGCASPYPTATPEAMKVQVFRQASTLTNQCRLIGPVSLNSKIDPYKSGLLGDSYERAVEQGVIQARERAFQMGGDAIVVTTVDAVSFYEVVIQGQALRCQQ